MRIINQRHDMSLNFAIINIFLDETTIYTTIDGKARILGRYGSEERAKEVFMGMNKISSNIYIMPDE